MASNAARGMQEKGSSLLIDEPAFGKNAVVYRKCPFSPLKVPVGRVKNGYECLIGSRLQCDTDILLRILDVVYSHIGSRLQCDTDRTVCSEYLSARKA